MSKEITAIFFDEFADYESEFLPKPEIATGGSLILVGTKVTQTPEEFIKCLRKNKSNGIKNDSSN